MAVPFSSESTTRFQNNAEDEFSVQSKCIVDRISLDIVASQAIYDLPSYVVDIKRITWRGWKLFPLPHRELRKSFQSGTQESRPYWYIFNNIGQLQIKLFPVPNETIAAISGTSLWGSDILNCFIIEFYRLPDYSSFKIPDFMRTELLTFYSNKRNYAMEGRTQDIKAAQYWNMKYETYKQIYMDLIEDLANKPRKLLANNESSRPYGYTPPPPILPIDRYGYSVDY